MTTTSIFQPPQRRSCGFFVRRLSLGLSGMLDPVAGDVQLQNYAVVDQANFWLISGRMTTHSYVRRSPYEKGFQRGRGPYQIRVLSRAGFRRPVTAFQKRPFTALSFLLPARASGWHSYDDRPVKWVRAGLRVRAVRSSLSARRKGCTRRQPQLNHKLPKTQTILDFQYECCATTRGQSGTS
jgi:hypothetical protein